MEIQQIYEYFKSCKTVSTDTRKLPEGCLFVALKGERFDGNAYALDALKMGAAYALVSDPSLPKNNQLIQVKDTLETLQQLALHHRRQFDMPVLAITGTNGKTTTKELVSTVLATQYKTHFTQGNFNNHIGVPLTLLAMPTDTQIAVIEMGANQLGDIDFLCKIAEPTHGLITNVGRAHLEGFGSFEGVKRTKSELYRHLQRNNKQIFVNADEPHLVDLIPSNAQFLAYRAGANVDYTLEQQATNPFVKVTLSQGEKSHSINTQLIGAYNFNNILTAVAVGKYFDVKNEAIKTALENYTPKNNRSQFIQKNTNNYILDAYNANPTSMALALQNFISIDTHLTKIAILGDMLELGEESPHEHQKIIDILQKNHLQTAFLVGNEFSTTNIPENYRHFPDTATLKTWLTQQNHQNTYFLIKGSRGIQLEKLLE